MDDTLQWITRKQWDQYAKRIKRQHQRDRLLSYTATSISNRTRRAIIEVRDNGQLLLVKAGWRQAMKDAAIIQQEEPHGPSQA